MKKMLFPKAIAPSVYDLDPRHLSEQGIKAVISDLDDTLTPYYNSAPNDKLCAWMAEMKERGIRVFILSNGKKRRVKPLCDKLGVECIAMAMKPLPFSFIRVFRRLGLKREEVVFVGDQIFTDILGGNLTGLHTILVEPIAYKQSKREIKKRQLEKPFRRVAEGKV
jgi:HAD superfamily phosphatase (TIGR01668 family)